VAVHLVQRGFSVRLITAGESTRGTWHDHGDHQAETAPLLESLAVLAASSDARMDTRWLGELGRAGLVVAVLGDLEERDLPSLRRIRHEAASAMAFVLDVPAWAAGATESPSTARRTAWLGAHGWRAVGAGPQDPLPTLWQELAMPSRAATATPGASPPAHSPEVRTP
jgi:hypothetical protein